MKKRYGICLLVLLFSLAYSVGFEGYLLTTEGDTLSNTVVRAKQGVTVVDACTSDEHGYYSVDFGETGTVPYQLPSDDLILGNSITSNGRVIAYTSNPDCQYNIFDIRGRNVTGSKLVSGKFFLQLVDSRTQDVLGVRPFINLSQGRMQVQVKSFESTSFAKASVADDSLLVIYGGTDMLVYPLREKVTLPEEGFEYRDLLLQRERRHPIVSVDVPDTLTIDTTYVLKIDAICEDYDAQISNIRVRYFDPDSICYEHRADSLIVSPHTAGEYTFNIIVDDNQGNQTIKELTLDVESDIYKFVATKLFNGLGMGRANLTATLRGQSQNTDENGLAIFEFPVTELTKNAYVFYDRESPSAPWVTIPKSSDSISVTDTINGTLQEGTGPFAAMKFAINPIGIDNGGTYILTHVLGDVIMDSENSHPDSNQVIDEPLDSTYWNTNSIYDNIIDAFVWIHDMKNKGYTTNIRGSLETGRTDLFYYIEDYINYFNYGQDSVSYREVIGNSIDSVNQMIENIADDEFGNGKKPYNIIDVSGTPDSLLAIEGGNTQDPSTAGSATKYLTEQEDVINDFWYTTSSGQYIDGVLGDPKEIERVSWHETFRGNNVINRTPESNDPDDIMGTGPLRPHDVRLVYMDLNMKPKTLTYIVDIETICPTSNP